MTVCVILTHLNLGQKHSKRRSLRSKQMITVTNSEVTRNNILLEIVISQKHFQKRK